MKKASGGKKGGMGGGKSPFPFKSGGKSGSGMKGSGGKGKSPRC